MNQPIIPWMGGKRRLADRLSINDHPDIRRVFEGFHFETLDIRYTTANQRQGKAEVTGELVIMNWVPGLMGGLF